MAGPWAQRMSPGSLILCLLLLLPIVLASFLGRFSLSGRKDGQRRSGLIRSLVLITEENKQRNK